MFDSEERGVPDESDRFLMDPVAFVSEYAKNWSQPSHIVIYDSEEQKLRNYLISLDYTEVFDKELLFKFIFGAKIRLSFMIFQ